MMTWRTNGGHWAIIDLADGGSCAVDVLAVADAVGVVMTAPFAGRRSL